MLKQVLQELKEGKEVVLEWYDDGIAYTTLYFNSGTWERGRLNCVSSYWLGLGTCQCNSHNTYEYEEITRKQALELIKSYIQNIEENEQRKNEEINFLNNLIESL